MDPLGDAVSRYNSESEPETGGGPMDGEEPDKGTSNTIQVPKKADGTYCLCFRVENGQLVVSEEAAEDEPASVPDATGNSLS